MVVILDVEAAETDSQQPGPSGIGVEIGFDVGGVDDLGESDQRRVVTEAVLIDEDLERAPPVTVVVAGAGRVEAEGVLSLGDPKDVVGRGSRGSRRRRR